MNMFADDAEIMREVRSVQDFEGHQRDRLQLWLDTWSMKCSPAKCKVMKMRQDETRRNL